MCPTSNSISITYYSINYICENSSRNLLGFFKTQKKPEPTSSAPAPAKKAQLRLRHTAYGTSLLACLEWPCRWRCGCVAVPWPGWCRGCGSSPLGCSAPVGPHPPLTPGPGWRVPGGPAPQPHCGPPRHDCAPGDQVTSCWQGFVRPSDKCTLRGADLHQMW